MDSSDINITFDQDGACNHCTTARKILKKGWFPNAEGQAKLERIADEIRSRGSKEEYDCIIGVSGGVDSSYLLHVAKKKMKLRPLVVHVDAGWNSTIATQNIQSLVKSLDLHLVNHVVDWDEMSDLQLAFLKSSVANQDTPQDHAFFAKLYDHAVKNNIRYVLTGSNLSSESILPAAWGYDATDRTQLMAIHNKFGQKPLRTYPTMSFFQYRIYWPYIKGMEIIRPLNFMNYDKNKAIEFLRSEYGWEYYGGKHHESKWTKFFQAYYLPRKFGYDKRKAHLSSIIVAGQMTRDEALSELSLPLYNKDELLDDKKYIASRLGISSDDLEELINLPNKTYLDYPNEERIMNGLRKIRSFLKL